MPTKLTTSLIFLTTFLVGCGTPNQANIELRKQNQTLDAKVAALSKESQSQRQMIVGLQSSRPTTQALPPDALKNLYVAYGIKFARLTGGADIDSSLPGDEGLRIYVTPLDEEGVQIQAAGSFVVEAFDLAATGDTHVGRWEFSSVQTKKHWESLLLESAYVLTCPWQKSVPAHTPLTMKVTFTDELSHATFIIQRTVNIRLIKATSQPAK